MLIKNEALLLIKNEAHIHVHVDEKLHTLHHISVATPDNHTLHGCSDLFHTQYLANSVHERRVVQFAFYTLHSPQ